MSDVTPKTESGRALLRDLRGSMYERLTDERTGTPIILAIEQEAASKAVAEVYSEVIDYIEVNWYSAILREMLSDWLRSKGGHGSFDHGIASERER